MQPALKVWEILFYFGIFLIPFDNWKFAPSDGWASISPYIFLASSVFVVVENPEAVVRCLRKLRVQLLGFGVLCFISCLSYLLFGLRVDAVFLTAAKILMGFGFLITLYASEMTRSHWLRRVVRLLICGYSIALIVGVAQWVSISNGNFLDSMFLSIFKRYYGDRIQFTFTEPSFLSVHFFGVIVPFLLLYYARYKAVDRNVKKLAVLSILMVMLSLLTGSSLRLLVDIAIAMLGILLVLPLKKKVIGLFVCGACVFVLSVYMPSSLSHRLNKIIGAEASTNVDASSAIRKFRAESAFIGYSENLYTILFGYGVGGSALAMEKGHGEAYRGVSARLGEIDALRYENDGLTYSMPIKLLAEHGVVGVIIGMCMIYSRRHKIMLVLLSVIWIQFDSYALYTFWVYLFAKASNVYEDKDVIG